MSAGGITAEPPVAEAPPPADRGDRGRYVTGAFFLLPAFFLLAVWMVYPAVYTVVRSFFGRNGYLGTCVDVVNRWW